MERIMSDTTDPGPDAEEDGDFWPVPTTARNWNLSPKSVWREVASGALEVVRLGPSGRSVRTTRRTREKYLAARRG